MAEKPSISAQENSAVKTRKQVGDVSEVRPERLGAIVLNLKEREILGVHKKGVIG